MYIMKCPTCKGSGKITDPQNPKIDLALREKTVKSLRKKGFSFHEIMLIVGYKSPRSITKILNKQ